MNKSQREQRRRLIRKWMSVNARITLMDDGTMIATVPSMAWSMALPPWKPEPGSPAYERMNGVDSTGAYDLKGHWSGSSRCSCVVGAERWRHSGRIFNGDEFDRTPEHKRCRICNDDFNEA